MTTPAVLTQPIPGDQEDYIYVCFGCDIILQDTTRRLDRILCTGPGRCIGCQYSVDGGFRVSIGIIGQSLKADRTLIA